MRHRADELLKQMINRIFEQVEYWSGISNLSPEERCDGVVFSILMLLDGGTEFPAVALSAIEGADTEIVLNPDFDLHDQYATARAEKGK